MVNSKVKQHIYVHWNSDIAQHICCLSVLELAILNSAPAQLVFVAFDFATTQAVFASLKQRSYHTLLEQLLGHASSCDAQHQI
jgi:hypothetical protein